VLTTNAERQRAVLSRYPGTAVLGRTEDLLDRLGDIDLVVISTPNATHASLAEAVLSHAKPVTDRDRRSPGDMIGQGPPSLVVQPIANRPKASAQVSVRALSH
jgi:hypothetical protein